MRQRLISYLALLVCWELTIFSTMASANEINASETITNTADGQVSAIQLPASTDAAQIKEHQHQILEDLNNRIKEQPDLGDNYFRRAFILYHLKQYKEASTNCDRAIGLDLNHSCVHLLKGEILFAQKNYNAALTEANKAISLSVKHTCSTPYALLAEIHSNLKNYAEGLQNISKAIDLKPQKAHYYEIRADLDYKVEQYLRCIADAGEAIVLNPKSKIAYSIRSKAYLAINDLEQAKADALKAKELPKDATETY